MTKKEIKQKLVRKFKEYANLSDFEYNIYQEAFEGALDDKDKQALERMYDEFNDFMGFAKGDQYAGNDDKKRSDLGQFYTPPAVVKQMIEMALKDKDLEDYLKNNTVFDPTAGSGNISAGEIAYGFNPLNVYANEPDEVVREKLLKPRLKKLGVPPENIFPNKYHLKKFGKFMEENEEEKERRYQEYLEEKGIKDTKANRKNFMEVYGAGNALNEDFMSSLAAFSDDNAFMRSLRQSLNKEIEDPDKRKKANKALDELFEKYEEEEFLYNDDKEKQDNFVKELKDAIGEDFGEETDAMDDVLRNLGIPEEQWETVKKYPELLDTYLAKKNDIGNMIENIPEDSELLNRALSDGELRNYLRDHYYDSHFGAFIRTFYPEIDGLMDMERWSKKGLPPNTPYNLEEGFNGVFPRGGVLEELAKYTLAYDKNKYPNDIDLDDYDDDEIWSSLQGNFSNIVAELSEEEGRNITGEIQKELGDYVEKNYRDLPSLKDLKNEYYNSQFHKDVVQHLVDDPDAPNREPLYKYGDRTLAEAGDFLKNVKKEAEQVEDGDKRTDEVRDDVSEPVAEALDIPKEDVEEAIEGMKDESSDAGESLGKELNSGYKDGQLERNEEQQAAKEEADRAAEEWRANQLSQGITEQPESSPEADQSIEGEQRSTEARESIPEEDVNNEKAVIGSDQIMDAALAGGSKKRKRKSAEELEQARNELDDLEFNPETDEDWLEYHPSDEERKALDEANRKDWIKRGSPSNKEADKYREMIDKQKAKNAGIEVENAIESNPEAAQEELNANFPDNPITKEANQIGDGDARTDEVNNEAVEKGLQQNPEIAEALQPDTQSDETVQSDNYGNIPQDDNLDSYPEAREQIDDYVVNPPEVVDYGLEDQNQYDNPLATGEVNNGLAQAQQQMDQTIADPNMQSIQPDQQFISAYPDMNILGPIRDRIADRESELKDLDEKLFIAQRHFDADPDEKTAKALKDAQMAYDDVSALLERDRAELEDALNSPNEENVLEVMPEEEKEETPGFIKTVEEEEGKPLELQGHNISVGGASLGRVSTPNRSLSAAGGSLAGLKGMNFGSGNAHAVGPSGNAKPLTGGFTQNSRAGGGSIPKPLPEVKSSVIPNKGTKQAGNVNHNGSINSGATNKSGGLTVQKAQLPSGFAHTATEGAGQLAGGASSGKPQDLREALLARIRNMIDALDEETKRSLGFSLHGYNYKKRRLEEYSGKELQEIEEMLEYVLSLD